MNKSLVTISSTATAKEAVILMEEKRFRHLPVTNGGDQNIIGIVSKRDLEFLAVSRNLAVRDFMSSPVQTIRQDEPIRMAIYRMVEKKISSLIVVDSTDSAVGIITTDDLLWHLAYTLKNDAKASQPLFNFANLQFVGEIATKLSILGI